MKTLGSILLTIIMFFASLGFTGLVVFRSICSTDNLTNLLTGILEDEEIFEEADEIFEDVLGDEYTPEIEKYFEKDELADVFAEFVRDYALYYVGVESEIPKTNEIQEFVEEAVKKYEKETGEKIDTSELDEYFDKVDKELKKEASNNEEIPKEVKMIASTIFSDALLYTLLAVIIVCAFLVFLITKAIHKPFRKIGIISIIDGALVLLLGLLLNTIKNIDTIENTLVDVINTLATSVTQTGLIFVGVGIVSVVVSVVLYNTRNKNIEQPINNQII